MLLIAPTLTEDKPSYEESGEIVCAVSLGVALLLCNLGAIASIASGICAGVYLAVAPFFVLIALAISVKVSVKVDINNSPPMHLQ